MRTVHMIVHGRVQGVGFRFYTRQKAATLGVKGWVKNKRDGTVEIMAQSDKTTMRTFIDAVKTGSPASQVQHVQLEEIQNAQKFQSFQVKL